MPNKSSESPPPEPTDPATVAASMVKKSAQQIWLAGLGAFAKAQEEGGKVFEALVQDGMSMQRKTQAVAEEKMAEVSHKLTALTQDMSAKAAQPWEKLETIFEARVAKALHQLGMPSAEALEQLAARLEALEAQVQAMSAKPKTVKRAAGTAVKSASKAPAAKAVKPARRARRIDPRS